MLLVKKHSMQFCRKLHICQSTYPHVCISFAINCICMKTNLLETKYNSHSRTIESLLPSTILSLQVQPNKNKSKYSLWKA